MILPDDFDPTRPTEELVDEMVALGPYDREAAQALVEMIKAGVLLD